MEDSELMTLNVSINQNNQNEDSVDFYNRQANFLSNELQPDEFNLKLNLVENNDDPADYTIQKGQSDTSNNKKAESSQDVGQSKSSSTSDRQRKGSDSERHQYDSGVKIPLIDVDESMNSMRGLLQTSKTSQLEHAIIKNQPIIDENQSTILKLGKQWRHSEQTKGIAPLQYNSDQHPENNIIQQAQEIIKRRSNVEEFTSMREKTFLAAKDQDRKMITQQIKDIINKGIVTPVNLKDIEIIKTPMSRYPSISKLDSQQNPSEAHRNEGPDQFGDYLDIKIDDIRQRSQSVYHKPSPKSSPRHKSESTAASGNLTHFFSNIKNLKKPHNKTPEKSDDNQVAPEQKPEKEEEEVYKDELTEEEEKQTKKIIEEKKDFFIRSDFLTQEFMDPFFRNRKATTRKHVKKCVIYPEQKWKGRWEILITFLLMLTCILTPYVIAFQSDSSQIYWSVIDGVISAIFLTDIIINFFSAYYDAEFNLIDDKRTIAISYIYSWFAVDVLSIIPFDLIFDTGSFNKLARVARIGKLYKIIRMTRLVRMLKIVKERNKLVKYLNEILKIGIGFERLLFMILIFFVLQHIVACLWVFTATFEPTSKNNWIVQSGYEDFDDLEIYISSFYFTVTTIVTVGFGDIHAYNMGEKIISVFLMLIGVISFSFATGSLSSIISNYDASQATLKEKFATLNEIKKDYQIGPDLYDQLRRQIKYDHSKNSKGIIEFMEELPYKLKIELSMEIHKDIYKTIEFFKYKEKSFIAWVGPLLRPNKIAEQEYIYKECDEIKEIYFLAKGVAGYVLPRFENIVYIKIEEGDHFGHVDIVFDQEVLQTQNSLRTQTHKNKELIRRFTVQAVINCEVLMLTLDEVDKMKIEFPDVFEELFMNSYRRLRKEMQLKIQAIKLCEASHGLHHKLSKRATSQYNEMLGGSGKIREYKQKNMKKSLTKSDVNKVAKFAQNISTLKQIDEDLEEKSSSSQDEEEDVKIFDENQKIQIDDLRPLETHDEMPNLEPSPPQKGEEQEFMNKFKKNFGRYLKKGSSQTLDQSNDEDVNNLKTRVTNIENMFSKLVESMNSIQKDLHYLKSHHNK